jgi:hypothetical protein
MSRDSRCPFCGTAQRETVAPTIAIAIGIAMSACGPRVEDSDGGAADDSSTSMQETSTSSTTAPGTTIPSTTASETTAGPGSTGLDTGDVTTDSSSSGGFIYGSASTGVSPIECSTWDQDCSVGEKCTPWANDGGEAWTATHCVGVAPEPRAVGDRCESEGSMWAGIDDCDVGLLCWFVDPETNEGTCVSLCTESADPNCMRGAACSYDSELAGLCLPVCDPKTPECPEGQTCLPVPDGQSVCG